MLCWDVESRIFNMRRDIMRVVILCSIVINRGNDSRRELGKTHSVPKLALRIAYLIRILNEAVECRVGNAAWCSSNVRSLGGGFDVIAWARFLYRSSGVTGCGSCTRSLELGRCRGIARGSSCSMEPCISSHGGSLSYAGCPVEAQSNPP